MTKTPTATEKANAAIATLGILAEIYRTDSNAILAASTAMGTAAGATEETFVRLAADLILIAKGAN